MLLLVHGWLDVGDLLERRAPCRVMVIKTKVRLERCANYLLEMLEQLVMYGQSHDIGPAINDNT